MKKLGILLPKGKDRLVSEPLMHDWEMQSPPYWFTGGGGGGPLFEWYLCRRCDRQRIGDPAPPGAREKGIRGGPFLVWDGKDHCDPSDVERAEECETRCQAGAGIERLAAALGGREVGYLYGKGIVR